MRGWGEASLERHRNHRGAASTVDRRCHRDEELHPHDVGVRQDGGHDAAVSPFPGKAQMDCYPDAGQKAYAAQALEPVDVGREYPASERKHRNVPEVLPGAWERPDVGPVLALVRLQA